MSQATPSSQSTNSISSGHALANVSSESRSQKRPTTARMHAVSPRKKARTDDSGNQEPLTTALDPTPPGTWLVKSNIGDCPPYTDHAGWVEDTVDNTVYMFGGTYPGDDDDVPTSDFYKCNTKTMEWQNLTDNLRFRDPSDPFSATELCREEQKLPCLSQPGLTLMRIHGTHFVFIFGGYSVEEGKAVSSLIAVDVDHLEWWYVAVEGGRVAGRIHPVVVAIEQRIYIFSGYGRYSKADPRSFRSYSIAAYQPALRRWTWEARDASYSGPIPPGQIFGTGIVVYGGKKIMLMPGRLYYQAEPLNFAEQKIFYFHTEHRQFQMAPHLGDYPKEVLWYSIHEFPSSSPFHHHKVPLPSRKSIGRPPKRAGPGPSSEAGITPPITSTSLHSPSIILCAWVPRHNSKYAVPELWRLSLSHNDEIRCLNKSQQIWDLNSDFQGCISTNDRIILLGNNNPKGGERWNIHLRVVLTAEDHKDKSQG
ncbi:hypothetical protein BYT27DRAFT_7197538 [Phlegmacium glaucopus]|nr:hypothetical protein BYT27DRAFT_7197538 [Phlegmacium glaucopus]